MVVSVQLLVYEDCFDKSAGDDFDVISLMTDESRAVWSLESSSSSAASVMDLCVLLSSLVTR